VVGCVNPMSRRLLSTVSATSVQLVPLPAGAYSRGFLVEAWDPEDPDLATAVPLYAS